MKKSLFLGSMLLLAFCATSSRKPFLEPHPPSSLWALVEKAPEKVLKKKPQGVYDRIARGFALYRLGRLTEAREEFIAARQEGEGVYSNLGLAMVEEAEGNLLEAYLHYLNSDHPLARSRAESIRERALQQALSSEDPRRLLKALLVAPQDRRVYIALGNYYLRKGRPFLARAYIKKGIERVGEDEALLKLLQLSYEQEGEVEKALQVARRVYELYPSRENLRQLRVMEEELERKRIKEKLSPLEGKPVITRGELALMIDAYLGKYLPGEKPPIIVDLYRSRQMKAILKVTALGIMRVYPNHTFQPDAEVRRIVLARVLYRLARTLGLNLNPSPVELRDTESRYALFAVGAGLMEADGGFFKPYGTVSFQEAARALETLRKIAGEAFR